MVLFWIINISWGSINFSHIRIKLFIEQTNNVSNYLILFKDIPVILLYLNLISKNKLSLVRWANMSFYILNVELKYSWSINRRFVYLLDIRK